MVRSSRARSLFICIEQEAVWNLLRAATLFESVLGGFFKSYGLTLAQLNILRTLKTEYPAAVNMTTLKKRLVAHGADATRLVDQLAKRRLVQRTRPGEDGDADRRVVNVSVSREGLVLLDQMTDPLVRLYKCELGHLDEGELRRLVGALRKVRRPRDPWDPSAGGGT